MGNWEIKSDKDDYFCGKVIDIKYCDKKSTQEKRPSIWIKLLTGMLIGFVNGFWGGGGGMLCVPLLTNIIKLPEKKSHATTLLVMLPLSIASLVVYMFKGNLPLFDSFRIGIGFVVGGVIGASLLKKISNKWLGYVFSIIIIIGGVKLLV